MTPSFQSMDSSSSSSLFTIGSHDLVNQDKDSSALLFRRPQGRPRNRPVGSNFGKAMLHPDDLNSPQGEIINSEMGSEKRALSHSLDT